MKAPGESPKEASRNDSWIFVPSKLALTWYSLPLGTITCGQDLRRKGGRSRGCRQEMRSSNSHARSVEGRCPSETRLVAGRRRPCTQAAAIVCRPKGGQGNTCGPPASANRDFRRSPRPPWRRGSASFLRASQRPNERWRKGIPRQHCQGPAAQTSLGVVDLSADPSYAS